MTGFQILVFCVVAIIVISVFVVASATNNINRFAKLGPITGMPMDDIIQKVGDPNSISAAPEGALYQWMGTRANTAYHFAILADGEGKAIGFTHQYIG